MMSNSSSSTNIRLAHESDARAIASIHIASWQKIYCGHIPETVLNNLSLDVKEKKWLDLINHHVKIFVIEQNNLITGFASICPSRDADSDPKKCGEISAIYFHPDAWRQGLGSKLCHFIFSEFKKTGYVEVIVWVLNENLHARHFYEKLGFKSTGKTKEEEYSKGIILKEVHYKIMI